MHPLPTSAFDFELPQEQIAQHPVQRRDGSRLLVLDRERSQLAHRHFHELADLIPAGDLLVLNETKVFNARLVGRRRGGGAAEVLLLHPADFASTAAADDPYLWHALVRPGGKLKPGREIRVDPELAVEIVESTATGERIVRLHTPLPVAEALDRFGRVPLPPYIEREPSAADAARYQTVYASQAGSVAAPTAGLHFTPELLAELEARGVEIARIVLHVGVGTFRPVAAEDPALHTMHCEWYSVPASAAAQIDRLRDRGGALWAVGTTVVRTLETVASDGGRVRPGEGWTDVFIRPPYRFRAVDRLITNFHLPRSTLLMLVAAFGGYDAVMNAYRTAVNEGYRFFSYGDAMAAI